MQVIYGYIKAGLQHYQSRSFARRQRGDETLAVPRTVPFLTLGCRFAATPHFSSHVSPRLPSRKSKHRIAVKIEVSNNEATDTYGGAKSRPSP